jgi:hypothetical protein
MSPRNTARAGARGRAQRRRAHKHMGVSYSCSTNRISSSLRWYSEWTRLFICRSCRTRLLPPLLDKLLNRCVAPLVVRASIAILEHGHCNDFCKCDRIFFRHTFHNYPSLQSPNFPKIVPKQRAKLLARAFRAAAADIARYETALFVLRSGFGFNMANRPLTPSGESNSTLLPRRRCDLLKKLIHLTIMRP